MKITKLKRCVTVEKYLSNTKNERDTPEQMIVIILR